jgi:hypothetical protein
MGASYTLGKSQTDARGVLAAAWDEIKEEMRLRSCGVDGNSHEHKKD